AQRPGPDPGPHHQPDLHDRERTLGRLREVAGEERGERRDGRVQRRRRERQGGGVVHLPVDLQELGVLHLPRGSLEGKELGDVAGDGGDVEAAGARDGWSYFWKAGMTSRANTRRLSS